MFSDRAFEEHDESGERTVIVLEADGAAKGVLMKVPLINPSILTRIEFSPCVTVRSKRSASALGSHRLGSAAAVVGNES